MTATISTTYALIWELQDSPHYQFTKDGKCFNMRTGRRIKQVVNGRSIGYCINGKFISASTLRLQLQSIKTINCPF